MKYYIADHNGILADLKHKLAGHLTTPRDADVWVVWQDVRGSYSDLIKTSKELGCGKPTYVVQHGGAATRDYGPPNNMKMTADKFLCWGKSDYDRLGLYGYSDKRVNVGCPLNAHIQQKVQHEERIVLFVPVSTGKEEPENIAVYYELMKMKYNKAQIKVLDNKDKLKAKWGFEGRNKVSFNELTSNFDVITKILPWHEQKLYHGSVVMGFQDHPTNNEKVFSLLRNVDLVVGLDEGTTEIFAYGHNIPVIIVEGFQYRQFKDNGRDFDVMDTYRTKASMRVSLSDLQDAIEYTLVHPEKLEQERKEVAELELGLSLGDPTSNILKVIKDDFKDKNINIIRP